MSPIVKAFHQAENHFFSMISIDKVAYDNITAIATGVPVSNCKINFSKLYSLLPPYLPHFITFEDVLSLKVIHSVLDVDLSIDDRKT